MLRRSQDGELPGTRIRLRALFVELLTRCPDIVAGDPELSPGSFFHVVKRMPCQPFGERGAG